MDEEEVPTASLGVWMGLIVMTAVSFWCQAIVTEERFVPALNVISDYYNIPDDIAGATLMAAGASSPELFSSIVALFVTHSALGLGTIVGSEIFNQLVICAGAVYASKTGKLQLDRAIVTREVGFYALAIALLYYALQDHRPLESDPDGPDHIFISFHEACLVFSGYIAYVIVCANMDAVVGFFTRQHRTIKDTLHGEHVTYGAIGRSFKKTIDVPTMPFVTERKVLSREPAANWNSVAYYMPLNSTTETPAESFDEGGYSESFRRTSEISSSIRGSLHASIRAMGFSEDLLEMVRHTERPDEMHSIHDLELNVFEKRMSCFLWQRSFFYTKAYFCRRAWHLRWFTITPENIASIPNRFDPEKHRMTYPRFREIEIDEEHLLLKIINPNPAKRDFTLMAPSQAVFTQIVQAFELYMDAHTSERETLAAPDRTTDSSHTEEVSIGFDDSDEHVDLIEFPSDGSSIEIALWLFLFPIRFLMHYTMPDVRQLDRNGDPMSTIGYAYLAALSCLVWLIIGSYAMVASLEKLADLMDVPDALIGVTVSAAGTSLPNYIASKVAAQNGFGNQAVSNAFGSNTFNIMVGLGLPWAMYTSFGTNFEPYSGLRDDGITQSIVILGSVLLVFVVLMYQSGFVLHKWHGILFLALYFAFIGFSIAQVFL